MPNSALLRRVLEEIRKARKARHRRAVVLAGDNDGKLVETAATVVKAFVNTFGLREPGIYVYHAFYEDGVERQRSFRRLCPRDADIEFVPYHESHKILGRTFDLAVIDFINNLEPNDLGRLSGVVQGGGLYVFLTPSFESFRKIITRFQSTLLTPQYGPEDIRHIFVERFIRKLLAHPGILIYSVDEERVAKDFGDVDAGPSRRRVLEMPPKSRIPKVAYAIARTQDQVEVLKLLEVFYEKPPPERKVIIVVTADRGRGKSSVLGLGLAGLAHRLRKARGRCRIVVTAPSEMNVQELFRFARMTLERLRYKVQVEKRDDGAITAISTKGIEIEYARPIDALRRKGEILAVDEAASLQVPMLFRLMERFDRIVYSSTIHGYEGAGRGFSVRFLGRLRGMPNVELYEYEMEEPIRYSFNDPIEKWAFDTLLLDAEPAQLTREDMKAVDNMEVEYYAPDPEEFFLEREDELRQFFGIYIMAHYRNNPNDLGMMMDAPHHFVRALRLKTGKLVVSLELAEEGPLKGELAKESARGAWIMGNIIPDRLIKHYKLIDFGDLRGVRVVRIATHPTVMRRGLGSKALSFLEEEAREKRYDWVGAGFGVTYELLRFWLKNGFVPVHMSPDRNPVSGEYSVLVIKPLNEAAKRYVDVIAWEFKKKFINSLTDPYFDLEADTALLILESTPRRNVRPSLSIFQVGRFVSYAWGEMTVENCTDCMRELARAFFLNSGAASVNLPETHKLLLVAKILQSKTWRMVCDELDMTPPEAMETLREAAKILGSYFYGIEDEKDAEKYLFLTLDSS